MICASRIRKAARGARAFRPTRLPRLHDPNTIDRLRVKIAVDDPAGLALGGVGQAAAAPEQSEHWMSAARTALVGPTGWCAGIIERPRRSCYLAFRLPPAPSEKARA